MASTLEEVPVRSSVPLQFRIVCAVAGLAGRWYYKPDYTINRKVLKILDLKAKASSKPVDGTCSRDTAYGEHSEQFVRIFSPSPSSPELKKLPIIVYFHGGGFSTLGADTFVFDTLCRLLAKTANAIVVSANYRLAPEFRYPTCYDDCWEALQWIKSDCQLGHLHSIADPSKVFLMGDSAGGNIAHFMMVRAARDESVLNPLAIKGVILMYPFFGGVERTRAEMNIPDAYFLSLKRCDWFWSAFLPLDADRDHPAANVFGPNAEDVSALSLPPILVMIGSMDILQDWQLRYVSKLREMGKKVQTRCSDMCHGEYGFSPEKMKQSVNDAVEFIKALL